MPRPNSVGASRWGTWRLALAFSFGLLAVPALAFAHLGHDVARAERYLKIEVSERGARFVVSLTLGPAEMAALLARADADSDGEVTEAEAEAYMGQWGDGLRTDLPVTVDGSPVTLEWAEPFFDPIGAVRRVRGSVELVAFHELDGGVHDIELTDAMILESLERTDVRLAVEAPVRLLDAGPVGRRDAEPIEDFYYGNDSRRAPDAVAMRVELPGPPNWQKAAFAGAAAVSVLLALLAWWRVQRAAA